MVFFRFNFSTVENVALKPASRPTRKQFSSLIQASKFCTDRGSCLPWIKNDEENGAVTSQFASSPIPDSANKSIIQSIFLSYLDRLIENYSHKNCSEVASSSTPAWVDQAVLEEQWRAAVVEPVQYFHWFFSKHVIFYLENDFNSVSSQLKKCTIRNQKKKKKQTAGDSAPDVKCSEKIATTLSTKVNKRNALVSSC